MYVMSASIESKYECVTHRIELWKERYQKMVWYFEASTRPAPFGSRTDYRIITMRERTCNLIGRKLTMLACCRASGTSFGLEGGKKLLTFAPIYVWRTFKIPWNAWGEALCSLVRLSPWGLVAIVLKTLLERLLLITPFFGNLWTSM